MKPGEYRSMQPRYLASAQLRFRRLLTGCALMLALAACKPEEPLFLSDGSPFGPGHLIDNVAVGANGTLHLMRQTAPGKGKGDPGRYGDVAFTDARSTSPHVLEVGELSPANGTFHVRGLAEGTAD